MAGQAILARGAVEHAELTDVGLRRANNQDSFAVALAGNEDDWRRRGHLFMVADGMGAHAAGELASKMACETVPHTYRKLLDRSPAHALHEAFVTANANIHGRGQANAEFQGMGTTSSALVLLPQSAFVAHVGDSRVYRLRAGRLEQLTFDHSLVWEMNATGQMPGGEVASFIPKNIITRSLGPRAVVQVDLEGPFALEAGDTFLLCSDGLSGQIRDQEIGAILSVLSPAEAVRALVDMANLRGGPDNVTALVVRVLTVPSDEPSPTEQPTLAPPASGSLPGMLWGLLAVCVLVSLALALTEHLLAALVSALLAAAVAVVALLQNLAKDSAPASFALGGPFGKAPHTTLDGVPSADSAELLRQMAQQLRDATKDEHWTLDWGKFNAHCEQAQSALTAKDYGRGVREYALAISFMMNEIRRQPARKDPRDNSVLDL